MNQKKKFWTLFYVFGFIGIASGLFSIVCCSVSPYDNFKAMSGLDAFLMGYLPCQFIYLPFYWLIRVPRSQVSPKI